MLAFHIDGYHHDCPLGLAQPAETGLFLWNHQVGLLVHIPRASAAGRMEDDEGGWKVMKHFFRLKNEKLKNAIKRKKLKNRPLVVSIYDNLSME